MVVGHNQAERSNSDKIGMIRLILLFFPIVSMASPITCVDSGKLKAIVGGNEVVEKVSYCFSGSGLYFLDKKCHQTKNCLAYQASSKRVNMKLLYSTVGTIPFKVCQVLGGHAHLARFWGANRWNPIGVCSFGDGSFIGTDNLYKMILTRQQR